MSAEEIELGRSAGWSPSLEDQDAALYAPCSSSPMPPTFGFEDCRVYEDAVSALDESSNLAGRIFAERELRQRRWDAERKGALAAYFRPAFQSGGFNNGLKLQAQDMAARNAAEHQRLSPRAAYGTPGAAGLREFDGREEHPERHLAGRFDACFATRSVDYDGATMRRQAAADLSSNFHDQPEEISLNNRPKKCRMSENHARLMPPKQGSMDLLFYTQMHVNAADMEAFEARAAAACGTRGPYVGHPDGTKNEMTRRNGCGAHPDAPRRALHLGPPGWCPANDFDACFATRSVDYDGATMRRQAAADQAPFQAGRPRELPRKLPKGKSAYLEEVVMSPIKVPRPGKRPEKAAGAALLRAKQARKQQETHLQHLRVTRGTLQQSTHRVQTPGSRHTSARPGSHIVGATMSTTAMGSAGSQIVNLMSIE